MNTKALSGKTPVFLFALFIALFSVIFVSLNLANASSPGNTITKLTVNSGSGGKPIYAAKGEVIVKAKNGVSTEELSSLLTSKNMQLKKIFSPTGWTTTRIVEGMPDPNGSTSEEQLMNKVSELSLSNSLEGVSVNAVCAMTKVPNDEHFQIQWNLTKMAMAKVWDTGRGIRSVIVAILDSGVAYREYSPYVKMKDFYQTFFCPGYDCINEDNYPDDDCNHGTHVAGIVAASFNNKMGIAGMSAGLTIMPVKVLDSNGNGTIEDLVQGIYYAVDHGANIINMSLSFPPYFQSHPALEEAIAYANSKKVTLIAAAGNDGAPFVNYPAAYNECIAVGSMDMSGQKAPYSNYGQALDVTAYGGTETDLDEDGYLDAILSLGFAHGEPGVDVGYWFAMGTSQAAPQVASLAGLLYSKGIHHPDSLRNIILKTADKVSSNQEWTEKSGYGIINPLRAITTWKNVKVDPVNKLYGYIQEFDGYAKGYLPDGFCGMIFLFEDCAEDTSLFCAIQDTVGLYGLFNTAADTIGLFEIKTHTLEQLVSEQGAFQAIIDSFGCLSDFVEGNGGLLGGVYGNGGLLYLLNGNGGLINLLNANGGMLSLLDANGGLIGLIAGNGGMLNILNGNGGLMTLLNGNGGMIGLLNANGGLLGTLNGNGGIAGFLDSEGKPVESYINTASDEEKFFYKR